jgi:hypothetical protein
VTALPLVTKTPVDDFTPEQRRKLAQMEACPPEPESFDGAAEVRRVLALLDDLAATRVGTPYEAGCVLAQRSVRHALGLPS